jgi:hypothetical protein
MKTLIFSILFSIFCTASFAENPRWKEMGPPIPKCATLDVRWEAVTATFPSQVWVYRLLPNRFSPEIISNVMNLCSLTIRDITKETADGLTCRSADGSRKLSISFPTGTIHYERTARQYGPTNLAIGVPEMSQLPRLATNILQQISIRSSDITGYFDGETAFNFSEPTEWYFVNHAFITNTEYRAINFRRSVDGIPVVGGNGGSIHFGQHGEPITITIAWRTLKPYKAYPTVSQQTMMEFLREGKAYQGLIPDNSNPIDWAAVKSVTIKKTWPSYFSGCSDWLYPYMAFWTTVATGRENVDVEIDCPIIDETRP